MLVRAPNWLGDSVLAAPAVVALRGALPGAHVAVLAREGVADFWRMLPVDEVISFGRVGGWGGVRARWETARVVRAKRFGVALILPNSFDAALVPWLAGVPTRVGWGTDGRWLLINQRIPFPHRLEGQSQARRYVYLVEQWLGYALEQALEVRLAVPGEARAEVAAATVGWPGCVIGLNPGATYGTAKCWLPDRFAEIACRAHARLGARVVIVGGAGDRSRCEWVFSLISQAAGDAGTWCVNLAGTTSVCTLAAWLERCSCLVTNDTGAMHVAAAVGTPVVAIFGPTDWRTTAPLGDGHRLIRASVPCAPCLRRVCEIDHRCMKSVSVEEVWEAVMQVCAQREKASIRLSNPT
ncbi:MAG: lipopolysaccharide heptosyltransferase II [bacterium]|nr:lipopolysaccharide heptosyltransferase II [bacterium]